MKVDATIRDDYQLLPHSLELDLFLTLFVGKVHSSAFGWTFTAYDAVPGVLIKDAAYLGKVALATRAFDSATQTLHALKLGVEVSKGVVMDVASGLYLPSRAIGQSRLGIQADHIPQVYGLYPTPQFPDRVCVAVHGEYDLTRRVFYGQMDFMRLAQLWKE